MISFQSLLHQGISLLRRSSGSPISSFSEFQSLLHQGISLLAEGLRGPERRGPECVSIPSSSGHQFTVGIGAYLAEISGKPFQSLLHQGISLLSASLRMPPCLCREEFQSLLHQGISLLDRHCDPAWAPPDYVSIPSSSGHQFTAYPAGNPPAWSASVSIPSSSGHQFTVWHVVSGLVGAALFQSLLHQGISLLPCGCVSTTSPIRCFNPFFIRASVYCHSIIEVQTKPGQRFNPFFIRASVYCHMIGAFPSLFIYAFQSLLHQGISLLGF